ncbi:hypothetical protein [Streptomyces sp. NBC_01594]|uniref:hypothetical protein n=1 Tax=Streptomyces sp. NBC_01594 TaxID=2975890 RepID=UPI00386E5C75
MTLGESVHVRSRAPSAGPRHATLAGARVAPALLTATVLLLFGGPATLGLTGTRLELPGRLETLALLLLWVPAVMLVWSLLTPRFNIAESTYWAWSFVFLGLAPAYQVALLSFPWKGQLPLRAIEIAQSCVLVGHVAFFVGLKWLSRRLGPRRIRYPALAEEEGHGRVAALLASLGLCYMGACAVFAVLMSGALFRGRAEFRVRLLEIAELPFGGLLYFLVTAGAITIPAALIAARRSGVRVGGVALTCAWAAGALVTNPLIGSRFLTGSFLVATVIALVSERNVLRYLPVASIVLLVLVFPSLDVLRGDGSGSASIRFLDPQVSLMDQDFDAFEMGTREVGLSDEARGKLPTRSHILLAPVLRWVPILSRPYIGDSGGALVAEVTGMQYTNVSMPLWAEGHLVGGLPGVCVFMALLGAWVGLTHRSKESASQSTGEICRKITLPGTTALLFIVLRGSLYEVLAYLALVGLVYVIV